MTTIPAVRRLSPRVRRLLDEHDLTARSVPGTGTGGRVVPRDVLVAGGVPRRPGGGVVLASPLARRLLRDAGVDPEDASAANDGRPLTREDARRVIDESAHGRVEASPLARRLLREAGVDLRQAAAASPARRLTGADAERVIAAIDEPVSTDADHASSTAETSTEPAPRSPVVELIADVAELLGAVATVQKHFVARHGFALDVDAPVAVALGAALTATAARTGRRDDDRGGRGGGIDVGFHSPADGGTTVRTVREAHDLTVAGMARRARAAPPVPVGDLDPSRRPTVALTTDPTAPLDVLAAASEMGALLVDGPAARQTRDTDHLGHEVLRTRPHVTLQMHRGDGLDDDDARELLAAIAATLTGWTRPVGS